MCVPLIRFLRLSMYETLCFNSIIFTDMDTYIYAIQSNHIAVCIVYVLLQDFIVHEMIYVENKLDMRSWCRYRIKY